jgi:hypothetical protein
LILYLLNFTLKIRKLFLCFIFYFIRTFSEKGFENSSFCTWFFHFRLKFFFKLINSDFIFFCHFSRRERNKLFQMIFAFSNLYLLFPPGNSFLFNLLFAFFDILFQFNWFVPNLIFHHINWLREKRSHMFNVFCNFFSYFF